ncbi:SSI family serine proteinase inhibitor [Spongisporangium articulatum]|uniref:SSI family serine proteinase inhibitor n=1 Tax=Spongisporangium articulatum TaxID=3362603 RepID=A0ABW8AKE2_9ACTN
MTGRRPARPVRMLGLRAGLAAGLALALTACGGTGSDVDVTASPGASAGAMTASADLTIIVTGSGQKAKTWHLTCMDDGMSGGDHPDPAAACAALARSAATALPPVGKDRMCTELYGGDDEATITGTWRGRAVKAELNRRNGCEISRWEALVGLLPKASGAGVR